MPPDVSYARSGDVAIAYQVVGSGPVDIVFVRGIAGDLLSTWDQPPPDDVAILKRRSPSV
jgi:hypothetical protein